LTDELIILATEAALETRCCTRSIDQPTRLIAIQDLSDDELAERQLAAWHALVKKVQNTISKEIDPDLEIQPAWIYVLQSVEDL